MTLGLQKQWPTIDGDLNRELKLASWLWCWCGENENGKSSDMTADSSQHQAAWLYQNAEKSVEQQHHCFLIHVLV